jgi:hypothetical protein
LTSQQILGVLRQRHIIVHGHPFNHKYGWNLETFARLYDIDKITTVNGEIELQISCNFTNRSFKAAHRVHLSKPDVRHLQGTLRDLFRITTTFPSEKCPPLNAISLPTTFRTHLVPSKWESIASHEVAQSRVPDSYVTRFEVPDIRQKTEWSLIGGKDTISSMHIDSEGFATLVIVLEGSKYWVVGTQIGDDEDLSSVGSLGPHWDPYILNEREYVRRYRFEAVHLQKGDMM